MVIIFLLEVICKSCACRLGLVRLHAFTRQRTKDSKPSFCNVLDGHTQPTENCFQNVIVSLLGKNWVKSQFLKPCNSLGNMPSLRTSKMEYTFFGLGNCAFGSGEINCIVRNSWWYYKADYSCQVIPKVDGSYCKVCVVSGSKVYVVSGRSAWSLSGMPNFCKTHSCSSWMNHGLKCDRLPGKETVPVLTGFSNS